MALDSIATSQQQPPTGNGQDITDLVLDDLKLRREAGVKKYGMSLRAFNGRDAVLDAYQEALDLSLYLRQKLTENRAAKQNNTDGDIADVLPVTMTSEIKVKLIQKMGGDGAVVAAARVSHSGEEALKYYAATQDVLEENRGLINYLMQHRHGTPFEHSSLTLFVHAPIFVWREWHRHRIGFSYNEESARYKKLNPVFWMPPPERKFVPSDKHTPARPDFQVGKPEQYAELIKQLNRSYAYSYDTYSRLIDTGIAKEVARAVLPVVSILHAG
jgi:flavin-dependent thymidylate synthase